MGSGALRSEGCARSAVPIVSSPPLLRGRDTHVKRRRSESLGGASACAARERSTSEIASAPDFSVRVELRAWLVGPLVAVRCLAQLLAAGAARWYSMSDDLPLIAVTHTRNSFPFASTRLNRSLPGTNVTGFGCPPLTAMLSA